MKTITSNGGPLIGISRDVAHLWGGIAGKSFVGEGSSFKCDYDAACELVSGIQHKPCNIARLVGTVHEALLITMPVETAIVSDNLRSVNIAQVEAAEQGWTFAEVNESDFEKASFDQGFLLHLNEGAFLIFDATYQISDVGDDYLVCSLNGGTYLCSDAVVSKDQTTELNLVWLKKV